MIKTELCEMVGIKHPIIQAGMGPYSTNNLAVAAANAGALGLMTSSGYAYLMGSQEGGVADLVRTLTDGTPGSPTEHLKKAFYRTKDGTKEAGGIFGVNVMVSVEMRWWAGEVLRVVSEVRNEDPEMRERFRVVLTSAGDPLPMAEIIKPLGVKWFHVVPSVRHAKRAERAGVDLIVASGHEGGMHIAWEPVHSMVLLPAVVNSVSTPVAGAGGFCDGATLVAALALGAVGVQMGTRFLTTKESEFTEMHKNYVLKSGERDTTVARGVVGPARYLKNEASMALTQITVSKAPGLYMGQPDDLTTVASEVMKVEDEGFEGLFKEDEPKALIPGGEVAGRVDDIPTAKELIDRVMEQAEEIIRNLPQKLAKE